MTMKKVCMSYSEFISKAKKADENHKANIENKDAAAGSGEGKETATDLVKGEGTPTIKKFTKEHMSNIDKKTSTKEAGKKK